MQQKIKDMRSLLLKKAASIGGIVAVCVLLLLALGAYVYSVEESKNKLAAELVRLDGKLSQQSPEYNMVYNSLKRFWEIDKKDKEGILQTDQNKLQKLLDELRQIYAINNLRMEMRAGDLAKDSSVTINLFDLKPSLVSLEFDSLSDLNIFSFYQDLIKRFPGYFRIVEFKMQRDMEVSSDMLQNIQQGTSPRVMSSSVKLLWTGIKKKDSVGADGKLTIGTKP